MRLSCKAFRRVRGSAFLRAALAGAALTAVAGAALGTEEAGTPAKTTHVETPALYAEWGLDPARLPYRKDADARRDFAAARDRARSAHKLLMVTFGANWCADCRALHRQLHSDPVRSFVAEHYEIVSVDVGDFDRNLALARELGVDLQMGIPVAVFYGKDGRVIGATNHGELEPARTYTSHQILAFLQDIAQGGRIAPPPAQQAQ